MKSLVGLLLALNLFMAGFVLALHIVRERDSGRDPPVLVYPNPVSVIAGVWT